MSDFVFPAFRGPTITIRDNGNNRLDGNDRIVINGHSYHIDRINLLGPRDPDRLAWEELKSTLRVSNFRSITSLQAAEEVYRIRQNTNTPNTSSIQFGERQEITSRCHRAAASIDQANTLAREHGMGTTEPVTCDRLERATYISLGFVGNDGVGVSVSIQFSGSPSPSRTVREP